jgi:hypothetical protein
MIEVGLLCGSARPAALLTVSCPHSGARRSPWWRAQLAGMNCGMDLDGGVAPGFCRGRPRRAFGRELRGPRDGRPPGVLDIEPAALKVGRVQLDGNRERRGHGSADRTHDVEQQTGSVLQLAAPASRHPHRAPRSSSRTVTTYPRAGRGTLTCSPNTSDARSRRFLVRRRLNLQKPPSVRRASRREPSGLADVASRSVWPTRRVVGKHVGV